MASFSMSIHVNAPPETVFHVCSDFANAPKAIPAIKRVEMLTPGPVGVGTKFKETRVMMKHEATEQMEVTSFDPPRSYTLGCHSCGCDFTSRFELTPEAGGTKVAFSFESQAMTLLAKLMTPLGFLMMGPMKKCIMQDLNALKAHAEGQATVTA